MGYKRNIFDLLALYEFEPKLRDIYVEGESDKVFLDWYLSENNITDINVYTINEVNIEEEKISSIGLNPGSNRSRVIALSHEFNEYPPLNAKVLCIADKDYEDYIPAGFSNDYLVFTDYTSMQLYFFSEDTIESYISNVLLEA